MSSTQKEIYEGLFFITSKPTTRKRTFSLNNTLFKIISFTLDLSSSTGVKVENSHSLIIKKEIPPLTQLSIANITLSASYKLSKSYEYTISSVPPATAKSFLSSYNSELETLIAASKLKYKDTDTLSLYPSSFKPGKNFIDPNFPPTDSSINLGADPKIDLVIHWRRPKDFLKGNFSLINDINPSDALQGQLGNCWFHSAVSCLSERPDLITKLFYESELNDAGYYKIKINKGGEWVTVVVDDYIPCSPYAGPVFADHNGNQIWVMLLEKAYAKVHGSYSLLRGGLACCSFMDLSGFPTLMHRLVDKDIQEMIKNDLLWADMIKHQEEGSLLAIDTPGKDDLSETDKTGSGIVSGHSYSVLDIREAENNRLFYVRNPWGNSYEWKGDWSDDSPLWTDKMESILSPVLNPNDGAFWIKYSDVLKHFDSQNACLTEFKYENSGKGVFSLNTINGVSWMLGTSYYEIDTINNSNIVISIHQSDSRYYAAKYRSKFLNIGFIVFQANGNSFTPVGVADSTRDVMNHFNLDGNQKFMIIPRVSGVSFTKDKNAENQEFNWVNSSGIHPIFDAAIRDLFRKWNLNMSDFLDFEEFSKMMKFVGVEISESDYSKITNRFPSYQDGVSQNGLVEYILDRYTHLGENTVKGWFSKWGYDSQLYSIASRFYIITVHGLHAVSFQEKKMDQSLFFKAHELWLRKNGEEVFNFKGVIVYSIYEDLTYSWIYGVFNSNGYKVKASLDLSKSSGVLFNGKNSFEDLYQPQEFKVLTYMGGDPNASKFYAWPSLKVSKVP